MTAAEQGERMPEGEGVITVNGALVEVYYLGLDQDSLTAYQRVVGEK